MATNRSYHDNCGMAHALDLIGERWSLLVIRELVFGPKRFGDLKRDLPGISTNMLTDRLAELERHGVLRRAQLPPPAGAKVYELTSWGAELETVIKAIGRWGASSPHLPNDQHVSAATVVMSLRTNFAAALAEGADLHIALRLGGETFVVDVADSTLHAERGAARSDDLVVSAPPATLAGMLYGGLDPATVIADGAVELTGDVDAGIATLRAFLRMFVLPAPARA